MVINTAYQEEVYWFRVRDVCQRLMQYGLREYLGHRHASCEASQIFPWPRGHGNSNVWTKFLERSSCFSRVVGGSSTVVSWAAIASPILGFPWRFDGVSWNVSGSTCIRNFWGSDAASILRAFRSGSCVSGAFASIRCTG